MKRYVYLILALPAMLLLTLSSAAAELEGRYQIQGIGADGGTVYEGTVEVERTDETYRVTWSLSEGGGVYVGTGILENEYFAVVYVSQQGGRPGLVLYEVAPDGYLTGYYTQLGGTTVSAEAWSPM